MDGSLFDALSGKTIKDANFNNWINGLENSEKAAMSAGTALDKYKNSLQQTSSVGAKAGAIFKSFAASVGTMAVMTIASKAIEVLGSGIIKTINYEKNMNKASSQMANSVKQSADNIDSYKTKIESLRETMSDSSSSIEDVTNARQELLSIQDEIIDKYGAEAEGIDLLNGSLTTQKEKLDEIANTEYGNLKKEYNQKDAGDHVKDFFTGNIGKTNLEQMVDKYDNYDISVPRIYNKEMSGLSDTLKDLGFEVDASNTSMMKWTGNAEDGAKAAEKIRAKVEELKKTDPGNAEKYENWGKSVKDTLTKVDDFVDNNKALRGDVTFYETISKNSTLKKFYEDLTDAQNKYQEAIESGDKSAMDTALADYRSYYDQIQSITDDDSVKRYFSNLYSSTNDAMKQSIFDQDIENHAASLLSSFRRIQTAYKNLSEAQLQSTSEVQALADQYGVSASYIVDKLKEIGVVQSDQYKELYSRFGDSLKTLTSDQLEIGYTIENVGDMSFDQFKSKIEESQRIASNEIDIKSRTNLDNYNTAKEGGSQSDDYDSYVAMMKAGKELAAAGKTGTEEFKAAARAFSENGMDDIDDWNENLAYLGKYFTEDASGAQTFIDTLQGMTYADGETPFAKLNEDGETYTLNLQDMQYMAEQLHMPLEMLSVLLQNLQSYGFSDSYFGTMEDGLDKLSSKSLELAEAKAKLSTMDPNQGTEYEAQKQKVKDLTDEITTLKDGIKQLREEEEKQPADTGALEGAQSLADQYNAAKSDEEKSAIKQSMDKYANEYNVRFNFTTKGEAEVSRSIEDINSDIDQARATLEKLSQDNGGKLNMDDSEVQDAVKQMQDLIAEKQTAEAPAIMQIDASGLDGEVQDAVQKLQNVQNIVNQIEQAKVVPGADTSQLESELSSAIADVKNLSPDITAKLNLNTAEIQSEADTVQAKITAHASISENDLNTIKTTVAAVDPQLAIDASDEKANAKLNDIIAKINSSTGQIQVGADLSSANRAVAAWQPPNKTATLTYNIVTTGGVSAGATVKVPKRKKANGTFHGYAKGTNVSIPKDETALVNEVGTEALLRNGILYEIPGGAHTVPLKKGDVIFNNKQLDQLKQHGYVTSNGGHGKLVGGGFADGTMHGYFGGSSGRIGGYSGFTGTSSSKSSSKSKSSSASSRSVASATKAVSKNTDAVSKNTSSNDDLSKQFDKAQDWLERYIKAFEDQQDQLERLRSDIYDNYKQQNDVINQEISLIKGFQSQYSKMYDTYMNQAYKSGLSKSYQDKVISGQINIEDISDETLKTRIEEFQKWADKASEVRDKVQELNKDLKDLSRQKLSNIEDDFDKIISYYNNITDHQENWANQLDKNGRTVTVSIYKKALDGVSTSLDLLREKHNKLEAQFNSLVNSGDIQKYSDDWYEWKQTIESVWTDYDDLLTKQKELNNSIRELNWKQFNTYVDKVKYNLSELDDLMDALNSDNFIDKNGKITKEGSANITLLGMAISKEKNNLANYTSAIKNLNKELQNGVITQDEYTEYSRDYLDSIRESSKAIDDYRTKILDMYKDAMNAENEALKDNISLRKEAYQKKKDYYDYDKTIRDKNKDINALKAQIAAMEGVSTATGKAELARLKAQLAEKQQDLDDTKQNHAFELISSGYDDLSDKADETYQNMLDSINRSVDMQEQIIDDMLERIKTSYKDAYDEISKTITSKGFVLSDNLQNDINGVGSSSGSANNVSNSAQGNYTNNAGSVVGVNTGATKGTNLNAVTSVSLNSGSITIYVGASYTLKASVSPASSTHDVSWSTSNGSVATVSGGVVSGKKAGNAKITVTAGGKTATCNVTVKNKPASSSSSSKNYKTATNTTDGHNLRRGAGYAYDVITSMPKNSKVTILNNNPKSADGLKWYNVSYKGNNGKTYTGWTSSYYLRFAKGTKHPLAKDTLAMVDDGEGRLAGNELVVAPKQRGFLTNLPMGSSVIQADFTRNLVEMGEMGVGDMMGLLHNISDNIVQRSVTNEYYDYGDCSVNIYPQTSMTKADIEKIADYSFEVWGEKMRKGMKATGRKIR